MSPVASGAFGATHEFITVLSGDQTTKEMVRAFQGILIDNIEGRISSAQAVRQAKKIDRRFGSAVKLMQNWGIPGLGILVALAGIYMAHRDSDSTSELMERMFNEWDNRTKQVQSYQPPPVPKLPGQQRQRHVVRPRTPHRG